MKIIATLLIFYSSISFSAEITGKVTGQGDLLPFANITIEELEIKKTSDKNGEFKFSDIEQGNYKLKVSYVGYITYEKVVNVKDDVFLDIELVPDNLNREEIVVTATRTKIPIHKSPIMTNRISDKLYKSIEAVSVSEGLNFSPGLRMETNCSNCGFNQVRMNGLEGYYSQILINSRPIYSALTGVYGLELIPANMIDRIEVVRGAGSAMYGSNAIAGTINIITKENMSNNYEINNLTNFIGLESPENVLNFNAGFVSDDLKQGINIFGIKRDRKNWDANDDGFSQLVKIDNQSFGIDAFKYINDNSKIKFNLFNINEERRGGNKFDYQPHQADIAEYLKHDIISGSISYESFIKSINSNVSVYGAIQSTERKSYYGAGGRVLDSIGEINEEDILALNAYGNSYDLVTNLGFQVSTIYEDLTFVYGSEINYNEIKDEMLGYNRLLNQAVRNIGNYIQVQYDLNKMTFISGFRYENVNLNGEYNLGENEFVNNKTFNVIVPRLSAMYSYNNDLKFRISYAKGFRSPQAFDEDLHIETVGGAARFINISENLNPEFSNNYSFSIDKTIFYNELQFNLILDAFYNDIKNSFILSDPIELKNGISVLNKRNSSGSFVYGLNYELNFAFGTDFQIQSGLTTQKAFYKDEEVLWESMNNDTIVKTKRILRTPNNYAYFNLNYLLDKFTISASSVYTGSMIVPFIKNIDTEYTELIKTNEFFELNLKLSYDFDFQYNHLIVSIGVQNIFNSYQSDFDRGKNRDASYVYGPARPRTAFISFKFGSL